MFARGHALYDEAGRDIVCAGVSAVLFGFLDYLEERHQEDKESHMRVAIWNGGLHVSTRGFEPRLGIDKVSLVCMEHSLGLITKSYPKHVKLYKHDLCSKKAKKKGGR